MPRALLAVVFALVAAAAAPHMRAAVPAEMAGVRVIDRVAWLAGCWIMRTASGTIVEEQWMAPRGGAMHGMSRTVRGTAVVEYEWIRIYDEAGTLAYAALPSRQAPAVFRATSVTDSTVAFENPQHDFPQRIDYRRAGDSLYASIAGPHDGSERSITFPFARVACP